LPILAGGRLVLVAGEGEESLLHLHGHLDPFGHEFHFAVDMGALDDVRDFPTKARRPGHRQFLSGRGQMMRARNSSMRWTEASHISCRRLRSAASIFPRLSMAYLSSAWNIAPTI